MRELNTRFSVLALVLSGFNFLSKKAFETVLKDQRNCRRSADHYRIRVRSGVSVTHPRVYIASFSS